jgi:O-antigen ligase
VLRPRWSNDKFFLPQHLPIFPPYPSEVSEEGRLRHIPGIEAVDKQGQASPQLLVPLLIILFVLIAFAITIPVLTPTRALALAAGVIVFVISFASTEIALFILLFSMLLSPEFVVGTTERAALSRGVTLRADDFLLVIIGFSWLAKMSINKELGLFLRTPLNKVIGYYIVLCLVSTLLGASFGRADLKTGLLFVLKYFEYMIVYFMVANHLQSDKQVKNYLWAMLFTCAVVSIVAITNIPGGGRVSAPFEGAAGEPNTFGGYLVFMISVVMGLLLTTRSFRNQLLFFALICLFAIPLFYTQSRSSYMAAIPAVLIFLWLSEKRNWILPALVLLCVILPLIAPQPARERIRYTFTQGINRRDVVTIAGVKLDTSTSARLVSWREASGDWIDHPILGHGVTGYRFVDAQYIRVIMETGLAGLILFFILIATLFKEAYRVFRMTTDPFHKGLTMGFLAGFVGLLFHAIGANTFIIVRIMEPFWFLAAMVIMIPGIGKEAVSTGRGSMKAIRLGGSKAKSPERKALSI